MSVKQTASTQGHPSRRDNQSVSSMSSARGSTPANATPAVESAVTRLLVSIKQLLEALTLWSTTKMDEGQVSDVYVRLGNDFNAAVAAFAAFNIDMSELLNVPEELRAVLEQCLAEDATPENLEIYLPTVREIITNLLHGLRGKQSLYRRIISDAKRTSSSSEAPNAQQRTSSRTSRSGQSSRADGSRSHRSQLSRTINEDGSGSTEESSSISRRSRQSSGRQREIPSQPVDDEPFTPPTNHAQLHPSNSAPHRPPPAMAPHPPMRTPSASTAEELGRGHPSTRPTTPGTPSEPPPPIPSSPPPPQVPAHVKRYSLVDAPAPTSPPAVVIEEPADDYINQRVVSPSPPDTPPLDSIAAPAMANSLAALKKSDTLERRASKRFSTYNISKMTGGPSTVRERSISRSHPNRRSLAASNTLTPVELDALAEEDEEEVSSPVESKGDNSRSLSRPPAAMDNEQKAMRDKTISPPAAGDPAPPEKETDVPTVNGDGMSPPQTLMAFAVFLQLGREVKKATIEPGLSFSSLRMLFIDKFSYNPGLENFPAIYIRDPSSGVQYELEDMSEVKQKCLLSLNIEPLDQIKQHIDSQISGLSKDIKDLKTAVASSRQAPAPIIAQGFAEPLSSPARPSDGQLRTVARRLSRLVGDGSHAQHIQPQTTGQILQAQMTGGSVLSEYSSRVVADLRTQFDEVQNLRRDLGIMRQLYTDFMKQTKESLGTLRTQTQSVKQLATTNVGGARGYIDSGKTNLDTRSQNILTKVEALQDTVENVKEDVIKRHITPKPHLFRAIKADIDTAAAELDSLKEHIKTIKPMWKKTWEEELQNIVEEQQFLNHQEEFLGDLIEDHKAVMEVYGHVEKVISIRGTGPGRIRKVGAFRPPPPEEGHNGLSTVMLEIRGASVDSEMRLKAIAANQKNREKDLATRSDEFQAELTGFVGGKKLKMTGGAEEAERVRKKRDEMTLKAMFNVNTGASGSGETEAPSPTSPSEFYDAASA
ncbi:hypothetical protein HWV62_44900 [Athelia sp. TMB]|nr:hypothetical protein HWV62_44900 [Athelia sp. TMB]